MGIRRRRLAAWAVAVSLWSPALSAAPVPFWGAKESSPVGTDPEKLKPGQFIWNAPAAPEGPIVIVASLPEQIARVYRNGVEIGVAKVSTGKPGHITPTGIFTILNKDKDHTLQDVRQRADAVFGEADLGRRRPPRGRGPGVPGVARLRAPADAVRRASLRDHERRHDGRHRQRRECADRRRAPGLSLAGFRQGRRRRGAAPGFRRHVAVGAREIGRGSGDGRRQRGGPEDPGPAQRRRDRPRRGHDRVPGDAPRQRGVSAQVRSRRARETRTVRPERAGSGSRCPVRASARERRWT